MQCCTKIRNAMQCNAAQKYPQLCHAMQWNTAPHTAQYYTYCAIRAPTTRIQYCIAHHISAFASAGYTWLLPTGGLQWDTAPYQLSVKLGTQVSCSLQPPPKMFYTLGPSYAPAVSNGLSLYWTPKAVFWAIVTNLWRAPAVTLQARQPPPLKGSQYFRLGLYCLSKCVS